MKAQFYFALLMILLSWPSQSASLGTYRVYLDDQNRQQKFPLINKSNIPENCTISFKNRRYDESGQVIELTPEQEESYSAEALSRIRYSPRSFTIAPNTTQNVMFSYRRKVNDTPGEVRTYAAFRCEKEQVVEVGNALTPVLELVVPVVIRTGKLKDLSAGLALSEVEKKDKYSVVKLVHTGNRSLYGNINLVSSKGEQLLNLKKNTVIYPDMKHIFLNIPNQYLAAEAIEIEFKEKGRFRDNQTIRIKLGEI